MSFVGDSACRSRRDRGETQTVNRVAGWLAVAPGRPDVGAVEASARPASGLIDRIHPAPELESRARELAASLAEMAPLTIAATKEATRRMLAALMPRDLDDLIVSCYLSHDFHEGVRAFLEKRKPDWQGR